MCNSKVEHHFAKSFNITNHVWSILFRWMGFWPWIQEFDFRIMVEDNSLRGDSAMDDTFLVEGA